MLLLRASDRRFRNVTLTDEGRAIRARAIALAGSSGYALPSSSGSWEGSAWVRDLAPMLAEKQELISRCISALPASVSSVSIPPATLLTPLPLLSLSPPI